MICFWLQFGHIDDCARISGKSVHDTWCHRKLPFLCRYKVNSSTRKETTKKNTILNSDDNNKNNNNNNNNVNEEENNDIIGTTTNRDMKENTAGKTRD